MALMAAWPSVVADGLFLSGDGRSRARLALAAAASAASRAVTAPRCPDACPHVPVAHAKAAADRLALGGIADQRPTWLTLSAALQLLRSDKPDASPVLLEMLLTLKPIRCVRCCLCEGAHGRCCPAVASVHAFMPSLLL